MNKDGRDPTEERFKEGKEEVRKVNLGVYSGIDEFIRCDTPPEEVANSIHKVILALEK